MPLFPLLLHSSLLSLLDVGDEAVEYDCVYMLFVAEFIIDLVQRGLEEL